MLYVTANTLIHLNTMSRGVESFLPVIASATLTALLTYFSSIRIKNIKYRERCDAIKLALRSEIYSNAYEFMEMNDIVQYIKSNMDTAVDKTGEIKKIIYSEIRFEALNALINNCLTNVVSQSIDEIYFLYAKFREFHLLYKNTIVDINKIIQNIKTVSPDNTKRIDELNSRYIDRCILLEKWSASFRQSFEENFLKKIEFINNSDWEEYKKRMKSSK